jgi:hypothetical protein
MRSNKLANLFPGERKIVIFIGIIIFLAVLVAACVPSQGGGPEDTEMAVEQTLTAVAEQPDTEMAVAQTLTAVFEQPDTGMAVEQTLTAVAEQPDPELVVEQTLTAVAQTVAATQTVEAEATSAFETAVAEAVATEVRGLVEAGAVGAGTRTSAPITDEGVAGIATAVEENVETRVAEGVQATADAQATADEFEKKSNELLPPGLGGGGDIIVVEVIGDSNVNVRSGPSEEYEIIINNQGNEVKLAPGVKVTVIGKSLNGWLNIYLNVLNDERGWIKGEFTRLVDEADREEDIKPVETIPPTPTPTRTFPTVTPTPTQTPTYTPTPTHTPDPSISITLLNNSSFTFCRLEIFLSIHSSSNNKLANPLARGAAITIRLEEGQGNYDARAWSCEDVLVGSADDVYLFDGFTWVIRDHETSNLDGGGDPFVGFDSQPLTENDGQ